MYLHVISLLIKYQNENCEFFFNDVKNVKNNKTFSITSTYIL